jgi:hypothetical protein
MVEEMTMKIKNMHLLMLKVNAFFEGFFCTTGSLTKESGE